MDKRYLKSHISRQFNQDMAKLLKMMETMGSLVNKQFSLMLEEIRESQDFEKDIEKRARKVRELEIEINNQCYQIMALRSPVASDLRTVIAILNATSEIRRASQELHKFEELLDSKNLLSKALLADILDFAEEVKKHFVWAYDSLCQIDDEKAIKAIVKQKKRKKAYKKLIKGLNCFSEKGQFDSAIAIFFGLEALYNISKTTSTIAKRAISIEEGLGVLSANVGEIKQLLAQNTGSQQ